jgi:hypothetical protein
MVYKYHSDCDTFTNVVRLFEFMKNHWFQLFQILREPLVSVISNPQRTTGLGYFKNLKEITSFFLFQKPQRTSGFGYFKTLKELVLVMKETGKETPGL